MYYVFMSNIKGDLASFRKAKSLLASQGITGTDAHHKLILTGQIFLDETNALELAQELNSLHLHYVEPHIHDYAFYSHYKRRQDSSLPTFRTQKKKEPLTSIIGSVKQLTFDEIITQASQYRKKPSQPDPLYVELARFFVGNNIRPSWKPSWNFSFGHIHRAFLQHGIIPYSKNLGFAHMKDSEDLIGVMSSDGIGGIMHYWTKCDEDVDLFSEHPSHRYLWHRKHNYRLPPTIPATCIVFPSVKYGATIIDTQTQYIEFLRYRSPISLVNEQLPLNLTEK